MTLTFVPDDGSPTWDLAGGPIIAAAESEGLFEVPYELVIEQYAAGDGGSLVTRRQPPRPILLNLSVRAAPDAGSTWASFLAKLAGGGTITHSRNNRELRNVVLEAPSRSLIGADLYGQTDDLIPVSLLALDPWWYGQAQTETVDLTALTGTSWSPAQPWNAPLSWNGGSPQTVNIVGDAPVSPVWGFRGPLSSLQVAHGGLSWEWQATLTPETGLYGTVDTRRGSRGPRKGSALYSQAEQVRNWGLLTESSRLFEIEPGNGQGYVVTAVGESGTAELTLSYEPRWLTP